MMIKEQTIFLDRDGVINRNRARGDYVKTWEEFEFLPGVFDAIARLKKAGYRLQQLRIIQPSTDCQATQPEFRRRFFKNKRPY